MNGFTFIIGGARSGKSAFALSLSEAMPCPNGDSNPNGNSNPNRDSYKNRLYVATAKAVDAEMAERIRLHKDARGAGWRTIEEPIDIDAEARAAGAADPECVVLFDCLTLWLSNLMEAGLNDAAILAKASAFASACKASNSRIIAVSNEVGMSIVPENALARRFRDLAGTINQITASAASEVFFIAAGLPLKLKGTMTGKR